MTYESVTKVPLLVTIVNGVVENAIVANDGKHLEELFKTECEDYYGHTPIDYEYDDGYSELLDATICMVWATQYLT
jgi:hypothetical protein